MSVSKYLTYYHMAMSEVIFRDFAALQHEFSEQEKG
jgi:hypothetical protein